MNQLKCDLCGSNELVKQNGFFVCRFCGTKYSAEEARRMMVEGTVKIDNRDFAECYLFPYSQCLKLMWQSS